MAIINEKLRAKLKETRLKQRYIFGCRIFPTKLTIEGNHPYKQMSTPELDCVHAYYGLRQLEQQRSLNKSELSILVELKDAGYAKLYGHYGLPTLPTKFDIKTFKAVPSKRTTAKSESTCCDEKKSTGFKRKFIKKMIIRKLEKSKEQRRQRKISELAKKSNTGLPEFHQLCKSPYSSKRNSIASTTTLYSSDSRSTSPNSSTHHSIDLNNDSRPLLASTQRSHPKSPTNHTRRPRVTVRGCPARNIPILPTLSELHEIATGGNGRQEFSSLPPDFNPNPPTSPYQQYREQQQLLFLQQEAEFHAEQGRSINARSSQFRNGHFRRHLFAGDMHRRNRILAAAAAAGADTSAAHSTRNTSRSPNRYPHTTYSRAELLHISLAHRQASPREQTEEYYRFHHLAGIADTMTKPNFKAETEDEDEDKDEYLEDILHLLFMVIVAIGVGLLWRKYQGTI